MSEHGRFPRARRTQIARSLTLTAALGGLAVGCNPGPETRGPAQDPAGDVQPEPELAEQPGDVDIGERAEETSTPPFTAQPDPAPQSDTDPDADTEAGADAQQRTQTAALDAAGPLGASAELRPTEGNDARGDVGFIRTEDGVEVVAAVTGLEPGEHGIHVHENGDCAGPAAESAGDHFAPDDNPHGGPADDPSERHAGDLGNISANENGSGQLRLTTPTLEIEGERGVVGLSVVVHENEDDLMSQPSGESGDAVACGVIERGEG